MKLLVYMIVKDESKNIPKILAIANALHEGDKLFLLDTGSTKVFYNDKQAAGLYDHPRIILDNGLVEEIFRFDNSRNESLSKARTHLKADFLMWVDADETLTENWRTQIDELSTEYAYSFGYDLGDLKYHQVRLVPYSAHHTWIYPAHEVLELPDSLQQKHLDHVRVTQDIKEEGETNNLLELLEIGANEYDDHRAWYYLAREYYYCKEYKQAIAALCECDRFENAYDDYRAGLLTAECLEALGDTEQASNQYINNIAVYPMRSEAYARMAFNLYEDTNDISMYGWFASKALKCPIDSMEDVYVCRAVPLTLLGRIELFKGNIDKALRLNLEALALCPTRQDIKEIVAWYMRYHSITFGEVVESSQKESKTEVQHEVSN